MSRKKGDRTIEPKDLFRLQSLQGAQLSPDGTKVAYTLSRVDADTEEEYMAIWLLSLETGEGRQLTAGLASDSNPQWSPDGKQIAFLSTRGGVPQVYLIPVDGGEARVLTSTKLGIGGGPLWSPDGEQIAFTTVAADEPPDPKKHYRVTRHLYRYEMMGYLSNRFQDIYVIPAEGGQPKRLTEAGHQKSPLAWSPDGQEILFMASMFPDTQEIRSDLRVVNLDGEVREILGDWGFATSATWTPDGKRVVFVGSKRGLPLGSKNDLWGVDREGGEPECRTAGLSVGVGGILPPDVPVMALMNVRISVTEDSQNAFVQVQDGGTVQIYRVALDGPESWEPVITGDRACVLQDANDRHLLCVVGTFHNPADLFFSSLDGSNQRQLTHINDDVLAQLKLPEVERLLFPGSDGAQVEGWIMRPPFGKAPYPTILDIHGGPHSAFGHVFQFDAQMLCGAGYAVLLINHRASTGYGDEFSTAIKGDWGNLDYKDLMAGVDFAIEKGFADPDRLGCCGISGGGYLSCWIVGQTDRFKAAVPENAATNFVSLFGTSDLGAWFCVEETGGLPHEIPEVYERCSPITYAHRCKTPTLLIVGEKDLRSPPEQAEQFYAALKAHGCTVEMLCLQNSPHAGSIIGPPSARAAQNEALLEWLDSYVLGIDPRLL